MKRVLLPALLLTSGVFAQQQEVGLTLGHILSNQRTSAGGALELGSGLALQANYGFRLYKGDSVAVYFETHFLANGQRAISSVDSRISRDVATLYVTPGIRMKFAPGKAVQPYVVFGGGYSLYEQSKMTLAGNPNPAPRFTHGKTIAFGGGADVKLWRFVGLRAEVRDFYSGNPSFNIQPSSSHQHNLVVGGGLVLRFGEGG
ncbi:MAG: outer membrane beta-barrel protein [Bryobacteraceae bacterium]